MGLRSSLRSMLSTPFVKNWQAEVRETVEQVLATRRYAEPGEVYALRNELEALKDEYADRAPSTGQETLPTQAMTDRPAPIDDLRETVQTLSKKLDMAMGAIQAATAQLVTVRETAEQAQGTASQALQRATSALATAEAANDGISSVEDTLAEFTHTNGANGAASGSSTRGCKVKSCTNAHRAKGFCASHYQQWRRKTLQGFVFNDGSAIINDELHDTGLSDAVGEPVRLQDGAFVVG